MEPHDDGLGGAFRSAMACLIVLAALSFVFMVGSFIAFGVWF